MLYLFSSYFVATQGNGEQNHQGPGDPGGGAEGQVLLLGDHDPRGEPAAHRRPLYVQERRQVRRKNQLSVTAV